MKLQTLASYLAFRSVLTTGKTIRGSVNKNDGNVGKSVDDSNNNSERDLLDNAFDSDRRIRHRPHKRTFATNDGVEESKEFRRNLSHDVMDSRVNDQVERRDPRIIGGQQASTGRYRYSVSLQDRIGHFCGGSLISSDVVLSAAHCAGGDYDVVVDRPNLNSNSAGQKIPMKDEKQHPNYNSKTTNNDFMLVFLDEPVDMTGGIELVELNSDPDYPNVGQKVTVMGYGDTNPSDYVSDLSTKLMEVEVKVISNDDCDDSSGSIGGYQDTYNGQITNSMICARETDKDACQGDSGGPLVVKGPGNNDKQVGVVSWGIGCASRHFPGVYARISKEYDWIREEVCNNSADPAASFNCDGSGGNNGGGNGGGSNNGGGGNDGAGASGGTSGGSGSGNGSGSESGSGSSPGDWTRLFDEDFRNGMGSRFEDESEGRFSPSSKGKSGVIRIQRSATMDTKSVDVKRYSRCQAKVSFMMIGMEEEDQFCVEFSSDGKNNYKAAMCFGPDEFRNKWWWEDQSGSFSVKGMDDIKVRLRCNGDSRKDDVLIDDVKLECQ